MLSDLTLLYYTANRIPWRFARAIRNNLLDARYLLDPSPQLLAVSQRKIVWPAAEQVTVGPIGASIYNVYRQILRGAHEASSAYIACCEDDTLYASGHFDYRPAQDAFAYDMNRWVITEQRESSGKKRVLFYHRRRHQMAMCVAPRALLIETLEERFRKWPDPIPDDIAKKAGWGEPGRYERFMALTPRRLMEYTAPVPSVTFNHGDSLMGRRRVNPTDVIRTELPYWGPAEDLWRRVYQGQEQGDASDDDAASESA